MAWTTVAEFYRYLRQPAPTSGSDEEAEAEQALDAAVAAIEDEAGQALDESTDTVVLDGSGGRELIVPRWPVTAVVSVTLLEESDVLTEGFGEDFTWSKSGVFHYLTGCWPTAQQSIEVVYTAGWAPVPLSLRRIAWRLAATQAVNPTGVESERIGDYQVKYKSDVIAGELTAADRRIISRYAVRE
ncbi:hypothetical protein [Salininema proteolyticum]|uniref:Head-to-tail adaptor n=1 Tax=Salininema proteolyticum TaxID=1607685 RepID=A0ABV8TU15_9ACTN